MLDLQDGGYAPLAGDGLAGEALEGAVASVGVLKRLTRGFEGFLHQFLQQDKVVGMVVGFVVGTAFSAVVKVSSPEGANARVTEPH